MANITRDGKTIVLTDEEILSIRKESHRDDITDAVTAELVNCEEDGYISFDSFADCPCADYASADDARADFIDTIVEDILYREEAYDHDPDGFRPDIPGMVYDFAVECEFWKGD